MSPSDFSAYPRDLVGYGRNPPDPRWPGGARVAVQFVINYEEGGFLYSSDSYADDLPYWIKGPSAPHLIIPYTLDANDMRFVNPQGFGGGEQFFTYLKDSFDVLYAEGETSPKMMSIGLHCRLAGRPGRAAALMRFLDYVAKHERVWVPTRLQIALHWHANLRHLADNAFGIG